MQRCKFLAFLLVFAILVSSFGCGGPASDESAPDSTSAGQPELTDDVIRERLNHSFLRGVPEESGSGEPIHWTFYENEPKEIQIVEKQIEDDRATIVLDIKTQSSPRSRSPKALAGQIRTEWALRSGWVLRQWEIVATENISMKYKNLPKPPDQNSNR